MIHINLRHRNNLLIVYSSKDFVGISSSACMFVSQIDEWQPEKIYYLTRTIIINNRIGLLCQVCKKIFLLH